MSIESLRSGIADNLSDISGLQVSAYMLANPTPPYAEVMPASIDFDATMARGADWVNFIVRVLVGATNDIGAQKRLDDFLDGSGSSSIKAVIESDTTLGGACHDLQVKRCTGYRVYSRDGGAPVLGAEWEVRVLA